MKVLGIEKPTIERNQPYQSKRELVLCVWVFDDAGYIFFLIGSCVDYSTKAVLILAFVAPHFNELGFSSNFDLTLMSFCT